MKTFALLAASLCQYHRLADPDLARVRTVEETIVYLDGTLDTLQSRDFANWQQAIDNAAARIGSVLPRPTPEATIAARALSEVRMCGTRAIGGAAPIGTTQTWDAETRSAIRRLLLAAITAVVMDRDITEAPVG
jgi:hypothetical protein